MVWRRRSRRHVDATEASGLLDDILEETPRLAKRVERLRTTIAR